MKELGTKYWTKPLADYGAAGPGPQAEDPFCEHDNCKQVRSPNLLFIYGWGENNVTFDNDLKCQVMSVLFYKVMRYSVSEPKHAANDRFILSKGHAAPILYAAWAEVIMMALELHLNI